VRNSLFFVRALACEREAVHHRKGTGLLRDLSCAFSTRKGSLLRKQGAQGLEDALVDQYPVTGIAFWQDV
jgi:hypothetical protein